MQMQTYDSARTICMKIFTFVRGKHLHDLHYFSSKWSQDSKVRWIKYVACGKQRLRGAVTRESRIECGSTDDFGSTFETVRSTQLFFMKTRNVRISLLASALWVRTQDVDASCTGLMTCTYLSLFSVHFIRYMQSGFLCAFTTIC